MGIIADTIEGQIRHTSAGWEDRRVYLVTEVTGDANRRKWNAANTPGVPRRGDPHPHAPGATVQGVIAEPYSDSDNSTFRVTIEYGGDAEGTAEGLQGSGIKGLDISTSTATVTRRLDYNGEVMQVSYQGPLFEVQLTSQTPPREVSFYQYSGLLESEIEVSVARAVITVERGVPGWTEHKRVRMAANQFPWSGDPADEWLILGVDTTITGNGRYDWRYQLAHSDETWLFRGEVTSASNNFFPPADATIGNGIEYFQQYRRLDFATLGFEIPT